MNSSEIHIRVYQRKTRKYVTTVEGLPEETDFKSIMKRMQKQYSCNAVLKTDKGDASKKSIHLTGDQRDKVKESLISLGIVEKNQIKIHGC